MTKQLIGSFIIGLVTLSPAIRAQVIQGGGPVGPAGAGGIHGRSGFTGAASGGFTGPRGGGFTETVGDSSNTYDNVGLNILSAFRQRRNAAAPLMGGASGNANPIGSWRQLNQVISGNRANRFGSVNQTNGNRPGVGWNNPYLRHHLHWIHGYWNGHYSGGLGGRSAGSGDPGSDRAGKGGRLVDGPGVGMTGWGLSSWMYGPPLYDYGYAKYNNPYYGGSHGGNTLVAQQPAVFDYSRPINAQSAPPAPAVTVQAVTTFETARQAFKGRDYLAALAWVDEALKLTPHDPAPHEFRALTLFALKRYDEAAAALYAVLSVEPGWDWTTLIGLYSDPETYTQQFRVLEAFTAQNPQSASARFVLAYHCLTGEHPDAAVQQLKIVTAQEPRDALSAQLIALLEHPRQQVAATGLAQHDHSSAAAPAAQTVADLTPVARERKIGGTWTSQPADDMNIQVTFQDGGRFTWKVSRHGEDQQFHGLASNVDRILTLFVDQNNSTIVSSLHWTDETHFVFKVIGAGPGDNGLSFTKTS